MKQKPTWADLPCFERGYFSALFFTTDEDAPGGMDYRDTGRSPELFKLINESNLAEQLADCERFQAENAALLAQAGDSEQNGMDFWFTRNGHGVGFWDRGYTDEIADPLTAACKKFGECYVTFEDESIFVE